MQNYCWINIKCTKITSFLEDCALKPSTTWPYGYNAQLLMTSLGGEDGDGKALHLQNTWSVRGHFLPYCEATGTELLQAELLDRPNCLVWHRCFSSSIVKNITTSKLPRVWAPVGRERKEKIDEKTAWQNKKRGKKKVKKKLPPRDIRLSLRKDCIWSKACNAKACTWNLIESKASLTTLHTHLHTFH